MVVNGKTDLVTSVFSLEPSATPTEKMPSYIDSEPEKGEQPIHMVTPPDENKDMHTIYPQNYIL